MFTASKIEIATYLLGVCPFSIAFLVFLNSSVSFVITDLIGRKEGVGNAVGSLGFADELLALVACPLWGLLSDRIGVRTVCVTGYIIIALALVIFVQAKNVYPHLLLGRLFFSLGGAAASTMVTAILPTMSFIPQPSSVIEAGGAESPRQIRNAASNGHTGRPSISSELTITPAIYNAGLAQNSLPEDSLEQFSLSSVPSSSRLAGFVGMATGCGALLALGVFLPLPARLQAAGFSPAEALQLSYYTVAGVALALAVLCFFGLRLLQSESGKGWRNLVGSDSQSVGSDPKKRAPVWKLFLIALTAGFTRADIGLGYIGGFVARASSVGISLFVPLLVNALFLSSGLCAIEDPDPPAGLPDIKRQCPRAYVVAAELTGVSQLVALLCAPLFGYISAKSSARHFPLMFAAVSGMIGYPLFANQFSPDDSDHGRRIVAFLAVCLIGVSQIGAIVCSLGTLSDGVLRNVTSEKATRTENIPDADGDTHANESTEEDSTLLKPDVLPQSNTVPLSDLKGSVAGVYSLYGGAAILILTKLGGTLFDRVSTGAPFYIMAVFNACLFIACVSISIKDIVKA